MSRLDPAVQDLFLLLLTGGLHLLFENLLGAKGPFLAAAAVVWAAWILSRRRRHPGLLAAWGLADTGGAAAWGRAAGFTLVAGSGLLALGGAAGTALPAHVVLTAVLYLPWALVQQVALQGILLRGLERLVPAPAAALGAALLFGTAHLPDLPLAALTTAGALAWTVLFRMRRSVWPLAASHAVLGTLAYTAVLGRDPWEAVLRALHAAGLG